MEQGVAERSAFTSCSSRVRHAAPCRLEASGVFSGDSTAQAPQGSAPHHGGISLNSYSSQIKRHLVVTVGPASPLAGLKGAAHLKISRFYLGWAETEEVPCIETLFILFDTLNTKRQPRVLDSLDTHVCLAIVF